MKRLLRIDIKKVAALLVLFFSLLAVQGFAQVSIAPTSLFFDSQNRFSSLTVSNGGNQPQEISITMDFGFPTSENGNIVISKDSTLADQKSIASWIKVFPQSFTLQSQQRQVVRFVVQPPQNLEPGGYWARVKISSNPVSPPIESVGEDQIGTQINLVLEQVIGAHFRTDRASTNVEVNTVEFQQNESQNAGTIAVSMEQTGNAPFIGSVSMQIKNTSGETVYQTNATTSVYTTITRTFPVDTSEWEPGTYTISGTITSQRRDISQNRLLQIQPVSFTKQITIE